jgi:hypothetical protein
MPFFFVLPLWVLAVIVGGLMVCVRPTRRAGIYVLMVSTFATLASFALSTAVLLLGAQSGTNAPAWLGLMIVAGYLAAIPIGGLMGAILGFLLTRKTLARLPR